LGSLTHHWLLYLAKSIAGRKDSSNTLVSFLVAFCKPAQLYGKKRKRTRNRMDKMKRSDPWSKHNINYSS
jgi:hypothetical protein